MRNTIIIGSGISGLFTLKHLKEVGIHDVLVIDNNPYPFGVWNIKNHPSVNKFTYCVSSKLYMTISDFPMLKKYPEFPHHTDILKYYQSYAEKFDLLKHVKNNVVVLKTQKKDNVWHVSTPKKVYKCKNLIIACGTVNNSLNIPTEKKYENFTGLKFHSDQYAKHQKKLVGKNILLIGVSDTACDIAEQLKNKNKICISSRKGVWLQNRNFGAYAPADMFYSRFLNFIIKNIIGKYGAHFIFGSNPYTVPFWWGYNGHGINEWKTNSGYLNSYYVKSRDIISSISKGQIEPFCGVKDIVGNKITFVNGETKHFDTMIFCSGYKPFGGLEFIDKKYYDKLYKHIFSYEDNSLYFVGYIRPYLTSIPILAELQSRWVAQEIKNCNSLLPSKTQMLYQINLDKQKQNKEFPSCSERLATIVDPYDYCDMIARKINAVPNVWRYFITDIKLFIIITFYSWNHHFYRLNNNEKNRETAYKNIIESSYNDTSKAIANNTFLNPVFILLFLIIATMIVRIFWRFLKACRSHNPKVTGSKPVLA